MRTTFGSGSSDRCCTQDGFVCLEKRNFGCHIVLGPESHGSTRMEKVADDGGGDSKDLPLGRGEKVKRKEVSALRCLTVTDILWAGQCNVGMSC